MWRLTWGSNEQRSGGGARGLCCELGASGKLLRALWQVQRCMIYGNYVDDDAASMHWEITINCNCWPPLSLFPDSIPHLLHIALPPSPQVCPFALMYSKWNSLSSIELCCGRRRFRRLIYWSIEWTMKVIQVCSSLFKSIHIALASQTSEKLNSTMPRQWVRVPCYRYRHRYR